MGFLEKYLPFMVITAIVIVTLGVAAVTVDHPDNTYTVTVTGEVHTKLLGITGLEMKNVNYQIEKQKLLSIYPLFFWQTGELSVQCSIISGNNVVSSSGSDMGAMNRWDSGSFECVVGHVPKGTYQLQIKLFQDETLEQTKIIEGVIVS